jgi:hypothetical protein
MAYAEGTKSTIFWFPFQEKHNILVLQILPTILTVLELWWLQKWTGGLSFVSIFRLNWISQSFMEVALLED